MPSISTSTDTATAFGELLRYWRGVRCLSQLEFAARANISSRHVSFMETGRSKPSRQMVVQIAEVLDVPLRERNVLLHAAGFAPTYREGNLDSTELASVRQSLEFLLERHNPYPAIVADRHWNLLLQNDASSQLLSKFVESPSALVAPLNVMRLLFGPDGIRPFVVNWDELSSAMIQRLRREAAVDPSDTETRALLDEALGCHGVASRSQLPDPSAGSPPAVEMQLRRGDLELRLFSAITTLGTPLDITLQELRLETFFPADDASQKVVRALVD